MTVSNETTENARTEVLLDGLQKILVDLDQVRQRDPGTMMLIGSLADRLCVDAGQASWPEVKAALDDAARQSLIDKLSREIEDSGKKGEIKPAYAMQAIAASLVGSGMSDERVSGGIALLDDFITAARDFFVHNKPAVN